MPKKAVLLVNLGSPDSTEVSDVRRYLKQFLMDPRVIDSAPLARWLVVNLCILPSRPKETSKAYSRIWTKDGSPLIIYSKEQQKAISKAVDIPVELAMTYGSPSIPDAIKRLRDQDIQELFVMPLYPHYAMSSYETAVVAVMDAIYKEAPNIKTTTLQPFYEEPEYIDALVENSQPYLNQGFDHLLFSFHGLPESHLRKADTSHAHCLTVPDCCNTCSPVHATCYRHQCFQTVKRFVEKARIPESKYSVSFQSRLGREPWLQPYTDYKFKELPKAGVKRLLVISPAFVSDCLETLEELAMAGKETFIEAGGETFHQIPCLNLHPKWIQFLINKINAWT